MCDATQWFSSLRQYDIHTEITRAGLDTLTTVAGGIFLSGWGARVQTKRGTREPPAIEGWGHYTGGCLFFAQQLESCTGHLHAQTTATSMYQVLEMLEMYVSLIYYLKSLKGNDFREKTASKRSIWTQYLKKGIVCAVVLIWRTNWKLFLNFLNEVWISESSSLPRLCFLP